MKLIPLTKNLEAMVDDDDYERVMALKWHAIIRDKYTPYASRWIRVNGKRKGMKLHHFVMNMPEGAPEGKEIDHRDGNGLNCQKDNLRLATDEQNQWNRKVQSNNKSGYKGVNWYEPTKRWTAQIRIGKGKSKRLGYFKNIEDAVKAYREAAIKYHGEFANF